MRIQISRIFYLGFVILITNNNMTKTKIKAELAAGKYMLLLSSKYSEIIFNFQII